MISQLNETVETSETNETQNFFVRVFSGLACEKKVKISPISNKCYSPTPFPILELNQGRSA